MIQPKPGDKDYIKNRWLELYYKLIGFGNLWAIIATVLLLWKTEAGTGVIDNSQWLLILSFVLGGRTLVKTFRMNKNEKGNL